MTIIKGCTSKVIHGWLWIEEVVTNNNNIMYDDTLYDDNHHQQQDGWWWHDDDDDDDDDFVAPENTTTTTTTTTNEEYHDDNSGNNNIDIHHKNNLHGMVSYNNNNNINNNNNSDARANICDRVDGSSQTTTATTTTTTTLDHQSRGQVVVASRGRTNRQRRMWCCFSRRRRGLGRGRNHHHHHGRRPQSRLGRCFWNVVLLVIGAALIVYYAFVHVHIIQKEDQVFYTTWFYEWFMIPILLSFAFGAPLHRSLGGVGPLDWNNHNNHNHTNHNIGSERNNNIPNNNHTHLPLLLLENNKRQQYHPCWRERLELLEDDPATQRLVLAVFVCYWMYVLGDSAFFIPLSPRHTHVTTYVIYLLAVLTNMAFIYQGFLLTILSMRVFILRLHTLEQEVHTVLEETTAAMNHASSSSSTTTTTHLPTTTRGTPPVPMLPRPEIPVLQWTQTYQELRYDMLSLSNHFGVRMVVGVIMFVVEVTNMILSCWESIGSQLTKLQTVLLIIMYAANAAVLIMVVFQTAYTATLSMEQIGPPIAILSLRSSNNNPDQAAELNVLAQTFMQAPIRLRAGNFHINADYANALTAWFFGLFLAIFGMKLPSI